MELRDELVDGGCAGGEVGVEVTLSVLEPVFFDGGARCVLLELCDASAGCGDFVGQVPETALECAVDGVVAVLVEDGH